VALPTSALSGSALTGSGVFGFDDAIETLESAVRFMHAVVRTSAPSSMSGDEARHMVDLFAQGERIAASGIALLTPRVVETGAHAKAGHGSAADWLGAVAGASPSVAKDRLASAKRASTDAALTEALHEGELSSSQLKLMGDTEAAAPGSAKTLLDLAGAGASHQELSDTAARMRAAARSKENEATRRERVHQRRHFRWRQCPEGGVRGEFFCDETKWAYVAPRLEAEAKARWKAAGSKDGASLETYRLDAFLDLMSGTDDHHDSDHDGVDDFGSGSDAGESAGPGDSTGSNGGPGGGPGGGPRPGSPSGSGSKRRTRVEALVIIDAEALRRGTTEGDELCEIEGIGPVSVAAGVELLGEAALRFVIKEGFDIKTVTRADRSVAKAVEAALIVRDRTCCVPGCGKRLGLEQDHVFIDYHEGGPTELDNLVRLCSGCHALKTFSGWRLEGTPGNFTWIPPAHPKSAGAISRARRLAAAKAQAGVTQDRNRPRRT
jgi:HNH endonuclease